MVGRLISQAINFVLTVLFVLLLPLFAMAAFFVPGMPADDIWFIKVACTVLAPFTITIWYIIVHRLLTHRRSSHLMQFVVFIGTALLIYVLLRARVYSL